MTAFQTVILAAGPNYFQNSGIALTKIRVPLSSDGLTLLHECFSEHLPSVQAICAVNPEDEGFAQDIARSFSNIVVKSIAESTRGALMTLALCVDDLDPELPIVVTSVDGLVQNSLAEFVKYMVGAKYDGGAMTIISKNPDLSYVIQCEGTPIEFAEKRVVSNVATTGIFFFASLELLKQAIEWVLLSKTEINGNYYISSALNRLIFDNKKVGVFEISPDSYLRFSSPTDYENSMKLFERFKNEKG